MQRRVRTFEQDGLDGWREGERPGRPKSLTPQQWKRLEKDLRKPPDTFGPIGPVGSLPSICSGIITLSLAYARVSDRSSRWGFRFRRPRPQVTQSVLEKVRTIEKTEVSRKSRRS